jgi:hypothetical protein
VLSTLDCGCCKIQISSVTKAPQQGEHAYSSEILNKKSAKELPKTKSDVPDNNLNRARPNDMEESRGKIKPGTICTDHSRDLASGMLGSGENDEQSSPIDDCSMTYRDRPDSLMLFLKIVDITLVRIKKPVVMARKKYWFVHSELTGGEY